MQQMEHSKKTSHIAAIGLLSAILLIGQVGMSFLPNIEPVTTLLILYTLVYKKHALFIACIFVLLEGLIFGFGIWWMSYWYIWGTLVLLVLLFQKMDSAIFWAIFSGAFGLAFGALCAIPYLISGGIGAAFAYWVNGIPFDLLHCGGNFVLTLILYRPLLGILKKYITEKA